MKKRVKSRTRLRSARKSRQDDSGAHGAKAARPKYPPTKPETVVEVSAVELAKGRRLRPFSEILDWVEREAARLYAKRTTDDVKFVTEGPLDASILLSKLQQIRKAIKLHKSENLIRHLIFDLGLLYVQASWKRIYLLGLRASKRGRNRAVTRANRNAEARDFDELQPELDRMLKDKPDMEEDEAIEQLAELFHCCTKTVGRRVAFPKKQISQRVIFLKDGKVTRQLTFPIS